MYAWQRVAEERMSSDGTTCTIEGLEPGTTYVVRAMAEPTDAKGYEGHWMGLTHLAVSARGPATPAPGTIVGAVSDYAKTLTTAEQESKTEKALAAAAQQVQEQLQADLDAARRAERLAQVWLEKSNEQVCERGGVVALAQVD